MLDNLLKLAYDHEPFANAKIAAALVKDGQVLSYGFNRNKTHPLQARFRRNEHANFLHAEIDAIQNAIRRVGKEGIEGAVMYVARSLRCGTKANAKPCEGCAKAIEHFKITEVYWTDNV